MIASTSIGWSAMQARTIFTASRMLWSPTSSSS
jgi:hypothetical protein